MTLAAASITSARDTGRGVFVLSAGLEPGVKGEAIQNPPLRTVSNRCANCIAVQRADFAGLAAEDQREVGASGASLPRRGASRPRLTKGLHVALQRAATLILTRRNSLRKLRRRQPAALRKYQSSGAFRGFAARALRVASLLHALCAAMIPAASDERNTGKGGTESADTGADQREGLCAPAHKLLALMATS